MRAEGFLGEVRVQRQGVDLLLQLGPAVLQALEFLAHVKPPGRGLDAVLDALEHGVHCLGVVLEALAYGLVTGGGRDGDAPAFDQHLVPLHQIGHQRHGSALRFDHGDAGLQGRQLRDAHVEQQGQGHQTRQGKLVAETQARHQRGGRAEKSIHRGDSRVRVRVFSTRSTRSAKA